MGDGTGTLTPKATKLVAFITPLGKTLHVTAAQAVELEESLYENPFAVEHEQKRHAETFDRDTPITDSENIGLVNCAYCWRPLIGERTQEKRAKGLIQFETSIPAVEGRVMDANREVELPYCRECLRRVRLSWRSAHNSVNHLNGA